MPDPAQNQQEQINTSLNWAMPELSLGPHNQRGEDLLIWHILMISQLTTTNEV